MTNQEAIETINIAKAEVEWNYPMNYQEAFDMAIEALEFKDQYEDFIELLYVADGCSDCKYFHKDNYEMPCQYGLE